MKSPASRVVFYATGFLAQPPLAVLLDSRFPPDFSAAPHPGSLANGSSFTRREGFVEDRGRGQASRSIAFSLHSAERSDEGCFGDPTPARTPFMGRTGRNGCFDNQPANY